MKILVHPDKNPNTAGVEHLLGRAVGTGAQALTAALRGGEVDLLLVLEDDVLGRLGLEAPPPGVTLLCLAFHGHGSANQARVLLPAAGPFEQDALFVNGGGRLQRLFQAMPPPGDTRPSYRWLDALAAELGRGLGLGDFEQAWGTLPHALDALRGVDPERVGLQGVSLVPGDTP